MRQEIFDSLICANGKDKPGRHFFSPTQSFWKLWKQDNAAVKANRFYPKKFNKQWRVLYTGIEEPNKVSSLDIPSIPEITKPFAYQHSPITQLCEILETRKRAIDASDTGAGKTYVGSFVAKKLGLFPIVICMKSAIGSWTRALLSVGFKKESIFVQNYEQFTRGKCYHLYDGSKFHAEDSTLVIVDEVHRCKNSKTKNVTQLNGNDKIISK